MIELVFTLTSIAAGIAATALVAINLRPGPGLGTVPGGREAPSMPPPRC